MRDRKDYVGLELGLRDLKAESAETRSTKRGQAANQMIFAFFRGFAVRLLKAAVKYDVVSKLVGLH